MMVNKQPLLRIIDFCGDALSGEFLRVTSEVSDPKAIEASACLPTLDMYVWGLVTMQLFRGSLQQLKSMPQVDRCICSALDQDLLKRPTWKTILNEFEQVIDVGSEMLVDALEHRKQ